MAQKKTNPKKRPSTVESSTAYMLKILLFFILGTFWLRLASFNIGPFEHISIPIGLFIGLLFAAHDHFILDQKIEYVILLISTFISFYLPVGILIK